MHVKNKVQRGWNFTSRIAKADALFNEIAYNALEAKAMAEKAMKDPMSLVNNVGALKFW